MKMLFVFSKIMQSNVRISEMNRMTDLVARSRIDDSIWIDSYSRFLELVSKFHDVTTSRKVTAFGKHRAEMYWRHGCIYRMYGWRSFWSVCIVGSQSNVARL